MKRASLALALLTAAAASMASDYVYNPGTPVPTLKVGDTLTFKLTAVPGAGYSWSPTTTDRDNLKFIFSSTLPAKGKGIGGNQTMVLRFLATAPGSATVTLQYGRPWELKKGTKPAKTIVANVTVD